MRYTFTTSKHTDIMSEAALGDQAGKMNIHSTTTVTRVIPRFIDDTIQDVSLSGLDVVDDDVFRAPDVEMKFFVLSWSNWMCPDGC